MSIAYDWDLIERLLHEVQNGAGHSFTPAPMPSSMLLHWPPRVSRWVTWIT